MLMLICLVAVGALFFRFWAHNDMLAIPVGFGVIVSLPTIVDAIRSLL